MHLQPNLERDPKPASRPIYRAQPVVQRRQMPPQHTYVLSINSSVHPDFSFHYARINLNSLSSVPNSTCTFTYFIEPKTSDPPPALNPLEALLARIHAKIPDEAWDKVPDIHASDINKQLYGR